MSRPDVNLPNSTDSARTTLRDEIAERLREDIISGALRPGSQVRDLELAQRYGASSSPVREAIVQVAGERLINSANHRVKFVAPLDKRTTQELFEMIRLLSEHAYGVAVPRITEPVLERLRDNLARQHVALAAADRRTLARLSWAFRDPAFELAGNREIHRTVKECYAWMQRLTMLMPTDLADQVRRYDQLFEALAARDTDRALGLYSAWADYFETVIDSLPDF